MDLFILALAWLIGRFTVQGAHNMAPALICGLLVAGILLVNLWIIFWELISLDHESHRMLLLLKVAAKALLIVSTFRVAYLHFPW